MEMALPAGLPTLEHTSSKNWTRPDNVWISETLVGNLNSCDVMADKRPMCTDHLPFKLELDTMPERAEHVERWDWRAVKWKPLEEYVAEGIKLLANRPIHDVQDFTDELAALDDLLIRARDKFVPKVKISPYMRRWWSAELGEARKAKAKLSRKAYEQASRGILSHPIHEEHRVMRNAYSQMIKVAKKEFFLEFLERVDAKSIWNLHKFVSMPASDGGGARRALPIRHRV
ncbi:hypothetical protein FIBSPDRAFT_914354 [Athelia psychrophila]|uniref:Uncharacterized protein n=1 Tax=Athelia psychrophila TaxID=1759441 RepID=A0A165WZF2_9AGAM|nr:hypothetical protein FIBSPDRAFT_914354 [Fibularhizoctonia sp. CBS 109695]